jgi:hypothetical protein
MLRKLGAMRAIVGDTAPDAVIRLMLTGTFSHAAALAPLACMPPQTPEPNTALPNHTQTMHTDRRRESHECVGGRAGVLRTRHHLVG